MKTVKADKKGIALAVQYLEEGKVVVYPTDTAYGLAVDALNINAVKRLYKIKARVFLKPVHVIVSSLTEARSLAKFDDSAEKCFRKLVPGPLTLILPIKTNRRSLGMLSGGTGTLGIRMADNKVAMEISRKLGRPITTTSANQTGGSTPYTIRQVLRSFKKSKNRPDLILDGGVLKKVKPSTLAVLDRGHITILRKGPVPKTSIEKAIK